MGLLVAGTKYRGEFEERLKKLMEEIKQSDEIILFIDEVHTLIGAGAAEGAIDAANILKPALSRGELQVYNFFFWKLRYRISECTSLFFLKMLAGAAKTFRMYLSLSLSPLSLKCTNYVSKNSTNYRQLNFEDAIMAQESLNSPQFYQFILDFPHMLCNKSKTKLEKEGNNIFFPRLMCCVVYRGNNNRRI